MSDDNAKVPSIVIPPHKGVPPPGPQSHALEVTPGHGVFSRPAQQLWIGGEGSLVLLMQGDTEPVKLDNVHAGTMLRDIYVVQIVGGTASGIVAFF